MYCGVYKITEIKSMIKTAQRTRGSTRTYIVRFLHYILCMIYLKVHCDKLKSMCCKCKSNYEEKK